MDIRILQEKIEYLPPELQREVFDFIDFLLYKYEQNKKIDKTKTFTFNWAGKLSNLKDKYTSVELQHKALEWW